MPGPLPISLASGLVLAVIDHDREVDIAVGHMARGVAARVPGLGLIDTEHVFVELGRLLEVVDLDRDVNDAGHGLLRCLMPKGEGARFPARHLASIFQLDTS